MQSHPQTHVQAHVQTFDVAEVVANQAPGRLYHLLSCEPLNVAELEISSLVLAPGGELSRSADSEDDQLYLLLSGQAKAALTAPALVAPGASDSVVQQVCRMSEAGAVAYQPAGSICTLQATGNQPTVLLVARLLGLGYRGKGGPIQTAVAVIPSEAIAQHDPDPTQPNFEKVLVFDSPTELIKRLYCFFLNFEPGEVVPVHDHDCHGVLLILMDGQIETEEDGILGPTTLMYYRGGAPHGFKCVGDKRMLAFAIEFYRKQPVLGKLRAQLRETFLGDAWRAAKAVLPGKSPAKSQESPLK